MSAIIIIVVSRKPSKASTSAKNTDIYMIIELPINSFFSTALFRFITFYDMKVDDCKIVNLIPSRIPSVFIFLQIKFERFFYVWKFYDFSSLLIVGIV